MLMKCVCGFIHPTSGIVLADEKVIGKDVDYLPDKRAGGIEKPGTDNSRRKAVKSII